MNETTFQHRECQYNENRTYILEKDAQDKTVGETQSEVLERGRDCTMKLWDHGNNPDRLLKETDKHLYERGCRRVTIEATEFQVKMLEERGASVVGRGVILPDSCNDHQPLYYMTKPVKNPFKATATSISTSIAAFFKNRV